MDPAKIKALLDALTANPIDPEALKAAATDLIASIAAPGASTDSPGADALASTDTTPPDPSAPGADPKKPPPGTPSSLAKDLGCKSDTELSTLFKGMQTQIEALTAERDTADLEARRELVAELVKLNVETPATAWQGDPKDRKPVKRLTAEPIADMKLRIAALRASRPAVREIEAPTDVDDLDAQVASLTKYEIAACKKKGMDLKEYVVAKAAAVRRI